MNIALAIIVGVILTVVLFFMPFVGAFIGALIAAYLAKKQLAFSLAIGAVVGVVGAVVLLLVYVNMPSIIASTMSISQAPSVSIPNVSQVYQSPQVQLLMSTVATLENLLILGFFLSVPGGVVGGLVGGYIVRRRLGKDQLQPPAEASA